MNNLQQEIIKDFKKKFAHEYDSGSYIQITMEAIEPIEQWLSEAFEAVRLATIEEVRAGNAGRCPRHDLALRCMGCLDELKEEKR